MGPSFPQNLVTAQGAASIGESPWKISTVTRKSSLEKIPCLIFMGSRCPGSYLAQFWPNCPEFDSVLDDLKKTQSHMSELIEKSSSEKLFIKGCGDHYLQFSCPPFCPH